jgi:hypothetical protein
MMQMINGIRTASRKMLRNVLSRQALQINEAASQSTEFLDNTPNGGDHSALGYRFSVHAAEWQRDVAWQQSAFFGIQAAYREQTEGSARPLRIGTLPQGAGYTHCGIRMIAWPWDPSPNVAALRHYHVFDPATSKHFNLSFPNHVNACHIS